MARAVPQRFRPFVETVSRRQQHLARRGYGKGAQRQQRSQFERLAPAHLSKTGPVDPFVHTAVVPTRILRRDLRFFKRPYFCTTPGRPAPGRLSIEETVPGAGSSIEAASTLKA